MTIQEKWVNKIKPGDLIGLVSNNWIEPIIFKAWNGQSAYNGYRAQYYWLPSGRYKEEDWEFRFKNLKDPDNWIHRTCSVNSQAERRFIPYPVEFLCKDLKKFIKQFKHLKGYEY